MYEKVIAVRSCRSGRGGLTSYTGCFLQRHVSLSRGAQSEITRGKTYFYVCEGRKSKKKFRSDFDAERIFWKIRDETRQNRVRDTDHWSLASFDFLFDLTAALRY